jgi:hypothetical protein
VEFTGRFDESLIYSLPESVKFVCHNGMLSLLVDIVRAGFVAIAEWKVSDGDNSKLVAFRL